MLTQYAARGLESIPHDSDAEAGSLACVLCANGDAVAMLEKLDASDFHELCHVEIFRTLLKLQFDNVPLTTVSLIQQLSDDGGLERAGGFDYLQNLPDKAISIANFPVWLKTVKDRAARRANLKEAERLRREAFDLSITLADVESEKNTAEALLHQRHFNSKAVPLPLRPIYELSGQVICTPANLTALTAAVKAGKTAVIGAMMGSAITTRFDADMLGFSSRNPKSLALLHFDSEQSPDDHWHCNMRALKRAGLAESPPWLHSYCLTGLDYKTAWKCVVEAFKRHADTHGGIHSTTLDGIADLVADVNDPAESNAFVAELHGMAIEYDCPIIGVIHFNPGSEKTRGHLGSQFERKAETNLRLDKTDEVTTIWSEKQRRAPIPKESGPCFAWSDEYGMHVSTATRQKTQDEDKAETYKMFVEEMFKDRPSMKYSDLVSTLKDTMKISLSTAERRIKEMSQLKVVKKSVAGMWTKGA